MYFKKLSSYELYEDGKNLDSKFKKDYYFQLIGYYILYKIGE